MRGFFKKLDDIDGILKRGSDKENARALVRLTTDYASIVYMFRVLDASWLEPLEALGYFRDYPISPNPPERTTHSFWPASGYLKRIAAGAAEDHRLALAIWRILSFMPPPDSFHVVRDMIDTTILLPLEMRHSIVPVIQRALSRTSNIGFANITGLLNKLAEDGQVAASLRLFATVFAVFRPDGEGPGSHFRAEPKAFMDSWHYKQEMEKCLGPLTRVGGLGLFQCLCRILDESLRISAQTQEFQGPDDYSYVWRPAIEAHSQNIREDPRDTVINAIRDSAYTILQESPYRFAQLIDWLDAQQWFIFTRLILYLLAESPAAPLDLIARYSTEPYLFSEVGVRHEYALLLRRRFKVLNVDQQHEVLRMVQNGPDIVSYENRIMRVWHRSPTEDELSTYIRRWQFDWLSFIEDDLPEEWKLFFANLKADFGAPEHPDFPHYATYGFSQNELVSNELGESSTDEEMGTPLETVLDGISTGTTISGTSEDSTQSLALDIRRMTEIDFETIVRRSDEVALLPPLMLEKVMSGLLSPGTAQVHMILTTLLRIGASLIARARLEDNQDLRHTLLELATRALSDLVREGKYQLNEDRLPPLREIAGGLLRFVRADGRPVTSGKSETMDPLRNAMSSLDGQIADAAIQVGLLERKLSKAGKGLSDWLFESLTRSLQGVGDDEVPINTVLGYRFPWLVHLSHSWAVEYASTIFPLSPSSWPRWAAAWRSYVMYSGAYDDVFEILSAQYGRAVDEMSVRKLSKKYREDASLGLAQHMAAYYWRGRLSLSDSLFRGFMGAGDERTISGFLNTIGRAMRDEVELPLDRLDALRKLANFVIMRWRPRDRKASKGLSAFGWWFPYERLGEARWRLDLLQKAIAKAGSIQNSDRVLSILELMAHLLPDEVVSCLRTLVLSSHDPATTYDLAARSERILENAAGTSSHLTRRRISEIADHLGSLGYFQFRRFA